MLNLTSIMSDLITADFEVTTDRVSAVGASQVELEQLYAKGQLMTALRADFAVDFGLDLLAQIYLHKRTTPDVLIGILKNHFKDHLNPAQACADAIFKAAEMDLIDAGYVERRDANGDPIEIIELTMRYAVTELTQTIVDRFQYPLPMIEAPLPVLTNRDTGYHTIKGSIILKRNHHDDDVCLDHINRMNQTKLAINPTVVAYVQNSWRGLDKRKAGETYLKFTERKKAFHKFDHSSRDVIDALLAQGNAFWLTHKYDKRGRTYSQGYHVNYQGNDWNKAVIEFAHAEPLNTE